MKVIRKGTGAGGEGLGISATRLTEDGVQIYTGATAPQLEYRTGGQTYVLTLGLLAGGGSAPAPTLAALGDSITRGDSAGGAGMAWPLDTAHLKGYSLTGSHGVNGSTVAAGPAGSAPMVGRTAAVLASNPGHIVVLGGTNDWAAGVPLGVRGSADTATFYGAARQTLTDLLAGFGGQVLVLTPLWRSNDGTVNSTGATLEQYRQAWRDVVSDLAGQAAGRLSLAEAGAALRGAYQDTARYLPDGLHPNVAGDNLLARYVANQLAGADVAGGVPVAWGEWEFRLASGGSVPDASGNGRLLTLEGNPTVNARGIAVTGGSGASGDLGSLPGNGYTITVAARFDGASGLGVLAALGIATTSGGTRDTLALGADAPPNPPRWHAYVNQGGSGSEEPASGAEYGAGATVLLTQRYDAATRQNTLFVNGLPVASTVLASPVVLRDSVFRVGHWRPLAASDYPVTGEIYRARVDGLLTDAQVARLYREWREQLAAVGVAIP